LKHQTIVLINLVAYIDQVALGVRTSCMCGENICQTKRIFSKNLTCLSLCWFDAYNTPKY